MKTELYPYEKTSPDKTPVDQGRSYFFVNNRSRAVEILCNPPRLLMQERPLDTNRRSPWQQLTWQLAAANGKKVAGFTVSGKLLGIPYRRQRPYGKWLCGCTVIRNGMLLWNRTAFCRSLRWGRFILPECLTLLLGLAVIAASGSLPEQSIAASPTIKPIDSVTATTKPYRSLAASAKTPPQLDNIRNVEQLFVRGELAKAKHLISKLPRHASQISLETEINYSLMQQHLDEQQWLAAIDLYRQISPTPSSSTQRRAYAAMNKLLNFCRETFMQAYIIESSSPHQAQQNYQMLVSLLARLHFEERFAQYARRAQERMKILNAHE